MYLLHRYAENLQQSLLEFKANYKLPKDQEKPNPVCMVAKQAYLWNYCQQKTKSRNEPYSDTPCAASWSSASNVFWTNRAHYCSLPCLPVSELCKILIILCTGACTLKCINLQSHVHTVTHCVIGFPLSTHWRKKKNPKNHLSVKCWKHPASKSYQEHGRFPLLFACFVYLAPACRQIEHLS